MDKELLERRVAYLEFVHDQLTSELSDIDQLLRQIGFPHGIDSATEVALDLLEKSDEGKEN